MADDRKITIQIDESIKNSISPTQTLDELNKLPNGSYYAKEAGSYAFGVTVEDNQMIIFNKNGSVWTVLSKVEFPSNKIDVKQTYDATSTDAISGQGVAKALNTPLNLMPTKEVSNIKNVSFPTDKQGFITSDKGTLSTNSDAASTATDFISVKKGDVVSGQFRGAGSNASITFYNTSKTRVSSINGDGSGKYIDRVFTCPDDGYVRMCNYTPTGTTKVVTITSDFSTEYISVEDYVKSVLPNSEEKKYFEASIIDGLKMSTDGLNFQNYENGFSQMARIELGETVLYNAQNSAMFISDSSVITNMSDLIGNYTPTEGGVFYTANLKGKINDYYLRVQKYKLQENKTISATGVVSDLTGNYLISFDLLNGIDYANIFSKGTVNDIAIVVLNKDTNTYSNTLYTATELATTLSYSYNAKVYISTNNYESFKFNKSNIPIKLSSNSSGYQMYINDELLFIQFGDEFTGDSINTDIWRFRVGEKSNGNNVKEAVTVADGIMKIRVWANTEDSKTFVQDADGNNTPKVTTKPYNGGGIISKFDNIKYGYFEASMKMPKSKDLHSSFWTTQGFINSTESALTRNEIDIIEFDNNGTDTGNNEIHSNIHKWYPTHTSPGSKKVSKDVLGNTLTDFSDNFNKFGCYVTENFIAFYVNRVLVSRYFYKSANIGYSINPTDIILSSLPYTNVDLGDKTEDFTEVEYVRYFNL
ncbi:glycoside hydrolase family 16 protein [Chishuiella sp.]|uniref:glycoside hydrolase family 16 protein n=1 Tax=Chishuiella sp. TaxID=1969467 RepID=UPI0028AD4FF7|nr:glycoside hydrolase family 16 protein [Chishuiella sp.]